jgi:hypothetical protein
VRARIALVAFWRTKGRILDVVLVIWIACSISFTLGWWSHARVLKSKERSSPADRRGIRKHIDLATADRGEKSRIKKAG